MRFNICWWWTLKQSWWRLSVACTAVFSSTAWLAYCLLLLGTRPSVLLARGTFEFRYPVDMNIPPGKFGCYFPLDNPKNHRQSAGMTYPFYATFPYHGAGGPLLVQNTTSTWLTTRFSKSYDGVQLSCAPSDDKVDTSHLTLVLQGT